MSAKYRHHRKTMMPTHYGKFSPTSKISLLSPVPGAMPSASKPVRRYRRNSRFYAFAYIFRFGFTLARWPFRSSFCVEIAARVRVPRVILTHGAAAICAAYLLRKLPNIRLINGAKVGRVGLCCLAAGTGGYLLQVVMPALRYMGLSPHTPKKEGGRPFGPPFSIAQHQRIC